jgi:hypothetical protein
LVGLGALLADATVTAYDAAGCRMGDGLYPLVEFTRCGVVTHFVYTKRRSDVVEPLARVDHEFLASSALVAEFPLEAK